MDLTEIKWGRHEEFDERSRAYPIRALLPKDVPRRSYTWSCGLTLDQGSTPACTGFSVTHEAIARPVVVPGLSNAVALALYQRAKELDDWPGEDYDGSSVLGAMKAGTEKGWYDSYRWAFSEDDLALSVGYHGPAVLGINWYDSMMEPNAKGIIKVGGSIAGGHAILCNGYSKKTDLYRLHNSWGQDWGFYGECFISRVDIIRLLAEHGEASIPVQRTQPTVALTADAALDELAG